MPLFYKRVAVVDEAKLANSSLKEQIGYEFARHAAFVPLIVTELFAAASTYPIVFITEPVPSVLAVLGLRDGQNLVRFGRRHEMGCDLRTGLCQALPLRVSAP